MEALFDLQLTGEELRLVLAALDAVGPPGDMDGQIVWMDAQEKLREKYAVVESAGGC